MTNKELSMPCCGCCGDPGLCLWVCCCPCFAFNEAANNIGSQNGIVYLLVTFPLGFGCCALTLLGDEVTKKAGIEMGLCNSALMSCCDCCCCYSCRIVNESRLIKDSEAVTGQEMER
eukprot:CAMPEP_0116552024 /NCGR_PEP_ID=MMETSP0397-20121206/6265_1 /TAXON_ID=216820 /ORGANISM="Cyclophora tenuis, Strain ECT3854" /LENGTH=116 /DNA_ID=CAMNT_0004076945 /DNA_START=87 /DNA_END=437 /DNA_ORIENTATION=+